MRQKSFVAIVLLASVFDVSVERLFGQGFGTNSPFSPWLNLNQKQAGPVDNYHMYVQPQMQLRNALQTQQADIQRNGVVADAVANSLTAQQAYNAPAAPTGMNAGFLNHGTYFMTNKTPGMGITGSPGSAWNNASGYGPGGAYNRSSGPGMPVGVPNVPTAASISAQATSFGR
jgi:hypothetical protein